MEDIGDEEVGAEQCRALAEVLAPQVAELNELMDDPLLKSQNSSDALADPYKQGDDDDMDHELEQLNFAEDLLRRELSLAQNFADFFGSSSGGESPDFIAPTALFESPLPHAYAEVYSPETVDADHEHVGISSSPSNQEERKKHADMDPVEGTQEIQEDVINSQGTNEKDQTTMSSQVKNDTFDSTAAKSGSEEYEATTPKKEDPQQTSYSTPAVNHKRTPSSAPPETPQTSVVLFRSPGKVYSSSEHFQSLKLRKESQGAWYSVDLTEHVANIGHRNSSEAYPVYFGMGMKEFCLSISEWKHLFVGMRHEDEGNGEQGQDKGEEQENSGRMLTPGKQSPSIKATSKTAPVRTISIRIRPDVLCGAVMDAVTQTLVNCPHSSIIKRQGGHLQGTVRGLLPPGKNRRSIRRNSHDNSTFPDDECTFMVDVQLCTQKSTLCERILLIRIYHWKEEAGGTAEDDLWSPSSASTTHAINTTIDSTNGADHSATSTQNDSFLSSDLSQGGGQEANLHLREACALIQRIESPELAKQIRPLSQKPQSENSVDDRSLSDLVSAHLLKSYRACPSVVQPDTAITLPSLSPQDWPVIQASWNWVQSIWDELETRELTYLTLLGLPIVPITGDESGEDPDVADLSFSAPPPPRFGAFPALPTLDVQYCSQLRRLSRENMISQLLKAASVLEEYARQAEYQCANLIDLLRPTFALYGVAAPPLPKPVPLAAYPLEYTPPQALCPPWGSKAMEALNLVAAMSHSASKNSQHSQSIEGGAQNGAANELDKTACTMDPALSPENIDSVGLAETAVQMVYEAFQKQDDEEQSARLARKNLQVMDRLGKMEQHHRNSVQALVNAQSRAAQAAANDFFGKAECGIIGLNGIAVDDAGEQISATPWREVPLLRWNIGVGGSSGTCTVTANQLIFTPAKLIPLVGRSQSTWFCLRDVDFRVTQSQSSLLNRLSTIQVLHRSSGKEVYSFRPSSAAPRLKSFLDILTKEAIKNPVVVGSSETSVP